MEILYQDRDIVVCIKPEGVASEGDGSMATLLAAELSCEIFPVHRLDRGTAGLMVFAKSSPAAAKLSESIRENRLQKEYMAVVSGVPAEKEGRMTDFLFKDSAKNKVFVVKGERKGAREARLSYRTLKTAEGPLSLVRVTLETGRTHQIRVQFASRKMPLCGDGKYGSRIKGSLALWSCSLRFPHPADGREMSFFKAPPASGAFAAFADSTEK